MTKLQKFTFLGFFLILAAMIYVEANRPAPLNWFESYNREHSLPFGTYATFELLKESLGESIVESNRTPLEKFLNDEFNGTYLFINDNLMFDETESNALLNWLEKGNIAFISANSHSTHLLDTLKLEVSSKVLSDDFRSQPMLNLVNPNLKDQKPYLFDRDTRVNHFSEIDTLQQTVLGESQLYQDTLVMNRPNINFLKAPVGKGFLYLHNQPEIFTNYFLLKDNNAEHTRNVLGYIAKSNTIIWDRYYKSGKSVEISPLYLLLNNKYLKWAYYMVLLGIVFYVFFEGKRKQRSIPIVKAPENRTFEYTRTISGMYLDKRDYTSIARKQIQLFLEYIRTQLRVPTERIDKQFLANVASRSGNDLEKTKELFNSIEILQKRSEIGKEDLIRLTQEISAYKNESHGNS